MLIVLAGYSATGKDTYQNKLLERNPDLERALSATTRPIRPGETDGVEYYFFEKNLYNMVKKDGKILSERVYYTIQNGEPAVWNYGLLKRDFINNSSITILDHEGARRVKRILGNQVRIIYMTCGDEELHERSKRRLDEPAEFNRRLADDKIQFEGIENIADLTIQTDVSMSIHEENLIKIEKLLEVKWWKNYF